MKKTYQGCPLFQAMLRHFIVCSNVAKAPGSVLTYKKDRDRESQELGLVLNSKYIYLFFCNTFWLILNQDCVVFW